MGCTLSSTKSVCKDLCACEANGSLSVDTARAAMLAGLFCDMSYEDTKDPKALIKVSRYVLEVVLTIKI